jgi:hypothetical protein
MSVASKDSTAFSTRSDSMAILRLCDVILHRVVPHGMNDEDMVVVVLDTSKDVGEDYTVVCEERDVEQVHSL